MVDQRFSLILKILYLVFEYVIQRLVRIFGGRGNPNEESVEGKTVIVTGANIGLGKYTALELARRGATVIMACRNQIEGRKTLEEIKAVTGSEKLILMELDLADLSSIEKFASEVKSRFHSIHILINNAGIYTTRQNVEYTKDGHEIHFGVNHLGHFLLTNLLLSSLKNGTPSRVVTVSSTLMMLEELDLEDLNLHVEGNKSVYSFLKLGMIFKPYNNSKFANALFSAELGRRLEGTGIATYAVCPGLVSTDVCRYMPLYRKIFANIVVQFVGQRPKQGIETILYCALSKNCEHETGQFYRFGKLYRVANKKLNDEKILAMKLWEESSRMVELLRVDQS